MKVVIVGCGYVGLTTGAILAFIGHDVECIDINPEVVERLNQGICPIHEPHLEWIIAAAGSRLRFSTEIPALADIDVVLIAVGTPGQSSGAVDFQYVSAAVEGLARQWPEGPGPVVANKSTVPVGAARHVESMLRRLTGRTDIVAVSNPEFLAEGTAVRDSLYPDRVLVGSLEERGFAVMQELFRPVLEQTFDAPEPLPRLANQALPLYIRSAPVSAELSKYAANCFLAAKVSFINEFAALADATGADITEIATAIGADRRIGPAFLKAGAGWGGSCFGKDTAAIESLAGTYGLELRVVRAAVMANEEQRGRIISKLQRRLKALRGSTVAVLGLSFKPGTDDVRDSPAVHIVPQLEAQGVFCRLHDPVAEARFRQTVPTKDAQYFASALEAAEGADAVLILTEWPEYAELDLNELRERMRGEILLDGRNVLRRAAVKATGLEYVGVGT